VAWHFLSLRIFNTGIKITGIAGFWSYEYWQVILTQEFTVSISKGRGRPKGSTPYPDDGNVLAQVADMMAADGSVLATTAIKQLGHSKESDVRRLQRKWQQRRIQELARATERRRQAQRRDEASIPTTSLAEALKASWDPVRDFAAQFAKIEGDIASMVSRLAVQISIPEYVDPMEGVATQFALVQKQLDQDWEAIRRTLAAYDSEIATFSQNLRSLGTSICLTSPMNLNIKI
jgi:uncharacterized protein YukE